MERYDIIVAGGGPSGVAAAIAAAREGALVLLIERYGYLGGLASNASVPALCPFTDGKNTLIGGIGMEILEELKKESYESPFYENKPDRIRGMDWFPIDSEVLKRVLDRMVLDSGCKLLLHSWVTGCKRSGERIQSVTIHNKSGCHTYLADVFIDCTGDADLTVMAQGAFSYGDLRGEVQAGTLCFKIANFNVERFMEYVRETGEDGNLNVATKRARADGMFPEGEKNVAGMSIAADGMASFNFGHIYQIQPLDSFHMTMAEVESRRRLPEYMKFIRTYVPGAEQAVLALSGPEVGTRESRRIQGEYCLTGADYRNRADFEDSIAYYAYPIDSHATRMGQMIEADKQYKDSKYRQGEAYAIPYRCLLHQDFSNLLTAGRTISCDRVMQASVRVMPACFATGQAAGCAAALAISNEVEIKALDVLLLQRTLAARGVIFRHKV